MKWDQDLADCEKLLDECSQYTPLIEPLENEAVYLDLSGCSDTYFILGEIGDISYHAFQGRLQAGLGTSRLMARIAAEHQNLCSCPKACYQIFSRPGIQVIEVLPGYEKEFISLLPLSSLNLFSPKQLKKLSRMGFSTIGELSSLSYSKLSQIAGENPYLLAQMLNGMDTSPVTGLYPPSRLTYPIEVEGDADLTPIRNMVGDAVLALERLLEERHVGCCHLKIEVKGGQKSVVKERQLSSPCYRAGQLFNIISGLLAKESLIEDLSGIIITLQDFSALSFSQPDLFSQRVYFDDTERKDIIEMLLQNLQDRYPDSLQRGMGSSRREQVLTLWDPWRRKMEVGANEPPHL